MGIDQLAAGLYNTPLANLQVGAPSRARVVVTDSIPANGQGQITLSLQTNAPDIGRGDGVLIENIRIQFQGNFGLGVASGSAFLQYLDAAGSELLLPISQLTATGLNVVDGLTISMDGGLFDDQDLMQMPWTNIHTVPASTPLLPFRQVSLQVVLSVVNSSAGSISAVVLGTMRSRFITGMQEG